MEALCVLPNNLAIPTAVKGSRSYATDKLSFSDSAEDKSFAAIFAQLSALSADAAPPDDEPPVDRQLGFAQRFSREGKPGEIEVFPPTNSIGSPNHSLVQAPLLLGKTAAETGKMPKTASPALAAANPAQAVLDQAVLAAGKQETAGSKLYPAAPRAIFAADNSHSALAERSGQDYAAKTAANSAGLPERIMKSAEFLTAPPAAANAALKPATENSSAAAAKNPIRAMNGTVGGSQMAQSFRSLLTATDADFRIVAADYATGWENDRKTENISAKSGGATVLGAQRSMTAPKTIDGQAIRPGLAEPRSLFLKETGNLIVALPAEQDTAATLKGTPATGRSAAPPVSSAAGHTDNLPEAAEKSTEFSGQIRNFAVSNSEMPSLYNPTIKGGIRAEQPVMASSQLEMITNNIVSHLKPGSSSLEVNLQPEALGKIKLLMQLENGALSVRIVAHTEEARYLLDANLSNIREGLSQQGLKVADMSLDFAQQQDSGRQTDSERQAPSRSVKERQEASENQATLRAEEAMPSADSGLNLWA